MPLVANLTANTELTMNVHEGGKEFQKKTLQRRWKRLVNQERRKSLAVERAKAEENPLFLKIIEATNAHLKRYGEELQTEISKKQRIMFSDTRRKSCKVKEEEPVKRVRKKKEAKG
ncbi:hypothetical protein Tco_0664006 [Tanacetum coccineum]